MCSTMRTDYFICVSLTAFPRPIDPNPAISTRAVFPQSGRIRPEKRAFLKKNPHFSKLEPIKNYEPLIGD